MNKDIDWALKQKAPHTCKYVLFILANRANKSHQCFPSLSSITHDTGLDRRTVMRSLTILEELQLITRRQRGTDTTLYTLMVGAHRPHTVKNTEPGIVGAQSPYDQGQGAPRGTAPPGAESPLGRGIDDTEVGAQRPPEPKGEPKLTQRGKNIRQKTEAPESIAITEDMRKWAATNGVTVNLETETEAMLDHHRRHGNLWVDWIATWRTWMRNSVKFEKRNGGNGNGNGQRGIFTENSGGSQQKIFGAVPAPYTPKQRDPV